MYITCIVIILSREQKVKALIRLSALVCTCWSVPLLFTYNKNRFSHDVAHIIDDAYQNAYTKHLDPGMNNLIAIIVPSLLILFDVMCFLYILPFMQHKFPVLGPFLGSWESYSVIYWYMNTIFASKLKGVRKTLTLGPSLKQVIKSYTIKKLLMLECKCLMECLNLCPPAIDSWHAEPVYSLLKTV